MKKIIFIIITLLTSTSFACDITELKDRVDLSKDEIAYEIKKAISVSDAMFIEVFNAALLKSDGVYIGILNPRENFSYEETDKGLYYLLSFHPVSGWGRQYESNQNYKIHNDGDIHMCGIGNYTSKIFKNRENFKWPHQYYSDNESAMPNSYYEDGTEYLILTNKKKHLFSIPTKLAQRMNLLPKFEFEYVN